MADELSRRIERIAAAFEGLDRNLAEEILVEYHTDEDLALGTLVVGFADLEQIAERILTLQEIVTQNALIAPSDDEAAMLEAEREILGE